MTKMEYYTMTREGAVLVTGYTDGTFFYYRNADRKEWYAVIMMCGLSIARGRTRAEVQERAYEPDRLAFVKEEIKKRGDELVHAYTEAIAAAQAQA